MDEKRIEVVEMSVKDLGNGFGNPRKISEKKKQELKESIELHGDFGLIVIDENNDIIAGNQRVSVIKELNPEQKVLCKRLVGYSEGEKRAINIKDNTHAGIWDLDMLAEWTADLNVDIGIDPKADKKDEVVQQGNQDMELIHYEKYDYVMIVCRYSTDYNDLLNKLHLQDAKVPIVSTRKIRCRAVWYDQMKVKILPIE